MLGGGRGKSLVPAKGGASLPGRFHTVVNLLDNDGPAPEVGGTTPQQTRCEHLLISFKAQTSCQDPENGLRRVAGPLPSAAPLNRAFSAFDYYSSV